MERTGRRSLIAAALAACILQAADADLILHNGKVVTVDGRFSVAQAVAVRDGRITSVGTNQSILRERGPKTEVIDLKGRTVLPGLIDSHVHPLGAGLSEFRQPLPKLDSYAAVQRYILDRAKTTPKGQWIVVPRTFPTRLAEMRMPTREVLDVATEHPVAFDASYVWIANSLALKMSGIDRNTPDPPGGEIVRDKNGEPNGILKNAQRLLKIPRSSESYTEEERLAALEGMLKRYVAAGLTSIVDRALSVDDIPLYEKLRQQGRLPLRVVMTWRPDASRPTEELVKLVQTGPAPGGDDWLRLGIFKLTLDGGMTIGTAFQRAPYGAFGAQLYGKTNPDDRGQLFIEAEKLRTVLGAARERGWSLTAHSQGGGAVDALLDAFEALDKQKPLRPTRSHVMHASFQSPEAIARAKKLGVLADVQAAWLYLDAPALEKVFGEGMKYFFPLRSYLSGGVTIVGGSDHMIGHDKNQAVNPYNPFLGMWTSVTRKTMTGSVIHPEQKISRQEALKSYTINGAYLVGAEKLKGSIEAGKVADFVIIDRDFLTCSEDEIARIEPVTVFIEGHRVWSR
jgi:predicted amidohydrolase YtcJ